MERIGEREVSEKIWNEKERKMGEGLNRWFRAAEELIPINIHKCRWLVVVAQRIWKKINGGQETERCREVIGQDGDEQCDVGGISQPAKFRRFAKFCKPGNFHTASKAHCLLQHLQK